MAVLPVRFSDHPLIINSDSNMLLQASRSSQGADIIGLGVGCLMGSGSAVSSAMKGGQV